MGNLRSYDDAEIVYFKQHPEEIEDYLRVAFEEFAKDGDSSALLSSLRVIARVSGVSALAQQAHMSRQGLQKALSPKGNPRLDNVNSIMQAMGYQLMPQRIDTSNHV